MLKSLLLMIQGGVLSKIFSFIVVGVLVRLGLGFALYVGFDEVLSYILTDVQSLFGGLPDVAIHFLGLVHADILINTLLSAYSTALIIVSLRKFRIL